MKKSRFNEEQIIGFLKEAEAVSPVADICRRGGFSDSTFYKWRAKFGSMEATEAQRLRALERENEDLKKLLAEALLDGKDTDSVVQAITRELIKLPLNLRKTLT
jgi:putative transposase